MNLRLFLLAGLIALLACPGANAAGKGGDITMLYAQMLEQETSATLHEMQHMDGMLAPLANLSGKKFDRAFYSMMIPHHQAAIDMSEKILQSTTDSQISGWAKSIIKVQKREIAQMQRALSSLGGIDLHYYRLMQGHMHEMVEGTTDDKSYLTLMIPHHQSAIDMAELAPARTTDTKLLQLAKTIIAEQQKEIQTFQAWLANQQ